MRHDTGCTGDCSISVIRYNDQIFEEQSADNISDCLVKPEAGTTTWIHLNGSPDPEKLSRLGEYYGLHRLALEDVLNTGQRPKLETYGDFSFMVLYLVTAGNPMVTEQICIFSSRDLIITLCENENNAFELVRQRLREAIGSIRSAGADYLLYGICDTLIDRLFPAIESIANQLDDLEEEIFLRPSQNVPGQIHRLRRDLLRLEKITWGEREVIKTLFLEEDRREQPENAVYLRDCYDHTVQVLDLTETYRDLCSGLHDTYLSAVSNQLNTIMKTLTIIATIFIPLTFLVGVYGMNFNTATSPFNMPELNWRFGYLGLWTIMIAIAAGMLTWFRGKKWI